MSSSVFDRAIRLYDHNHTFKQDLTSHVTEGCWFDLQRRGGCGSGNINLHWQAPGSISVSDWVEMKGVDLSSSSGGSGRWYYGRIERITYTHPSGVQCQLFGPVVQLSENYPGSYQAPARFGLDTNSWDPDYDAQQSQSVDGSIASLYSKVFGLIISQTDITLGTTEASGQSFEQVVLRGEESALSVLKTLAMWSNDASFGVNADLELFLLQKTNYNTIIKTYQLGDQVVLNSEERSRDLLYNHLEIVGGYSYNAITRGSINDSVRTSESSEVEYVGNYQYRNTFVRSASITRWGRKPIRLFLPNIRRHADAVSFAKKFLAVYGEPRNTYNVTVPGEFELVNPWAGRIRLQDHLGNNLITARAQSIRYAFDNIPVLTFTLGVADPKDLWPGAEFDIPHVVGGDGAGNYWFPPSSANASSVIQSDVDATSYSYSSEC